MNRIFVYILLLLTCSCSVSNRERLMEESNPEDIYNNTIEKQFLAADLDEETRQAFEERAKQKLMDFQDYFNMLIQQDLDSIMRTETYNQVLMSFGGQNDSINMNYNYIFINELNNIDIINALNKIYIHNISIEENLIRNKSGYSGKLAFDLEYSDSFKSKKTVKFEVRKTPKEFGSESQNVWTLYLRSIN